MLDLPQTHCESKQVFAEIIMHRVNHAQLNMIAAAYHMYDGDMDRKVLKAALDNFRMKEPLTVSEFGIKIYGECEDEIIYPQARNLR